MRWSCWCQAPLGGVRTKAEREENDACVKQGQTNPPIRTGSKTHWAVEGEQRKRSGWRRLGDQKKPKMTQTLFDMMEGKREGGREKPTKVDGMLLISCFGVRMDKEWGWVAVGAAHTVSAN